MTAASIHEKDLEEKIAIRILAKIARRRGIISSSFYMKFFRKSLIIPPVLINNKYISKNICLK